MRLKRVQGHIWCIWHLSLHFKHLRVENCKHSTIAHSNVSHILIEFWCFSFLSSTNIIIFLSYSIVSNEEKLLDNSFLGYTYEIFSSQTFFHHRTKLLNILVVNKSHEKLLFVIAARCNGIGYKNKVYMNNCVDNLFIDPNKLHFFNILCIFIDYLYI